MASGCEPIERRWWSSYVRAMIELRADVELKDNIVAAMPKITGDDYYIFNIRVEYEWKPPRCPVSKKPTANASVNKKQNVEPAKEVSKSNPFEVLTSVENDMELGANGGTSYLASQATNSSGSSFYNVDASSTITTPIVEKIDKIEKLIIEGKITLVDDEGKPLEKVSSSCEYDSEDGVASVDNEMANFLAKKDGYGTQSLLEQWTESYENADNGYGPYDDDMFEGVPVTSFSEDGLSAIAAKLVMIELLADVELKDIIVVAMPKLMGRGGVSQNSGLGAGADETKKKSSQAPKGIPVGLKITFKSNQEYRHVPKKHNANFRGNKKKGVDSTNKNVENSSTSTTPTMDKIKKFKNLIINGQAILVDEASNPLKKVVYPGNHDSENEVASVDNDMAHSLASERTGFGTQSKLRLLDNDGKPLVPTGIVESDSEVEVVFDETANIRISTNGKDRSDKGYDTNSLLEL
ncbi:hypothetical protein Tco_0001792 [Tanacetum coccineum]